MGGYTRPDTWHLLLEAGIYPGGVYITADTIQQLAASLETTRAGGWWGAQHPAGPAVTDRDPYTPHAAGGALAQLVARRRAGVWELWGRVVWARPSAVLPYLQPRMQALSCSWLPDGGTSRTTGQHMPGPLLADVCVLLWSSHILPVAFLTEQASESVWVPAELPR